MQHLFVVNLLITGTDVKLLRQKYGWRQDQFADVIGRTANTVYRWEALGDTPLQIDGNCTRLLTVLQEVSQRTDPARFERARSINGGLYALWEILTVQFTANSG